MKNYTLASFMLLLILFSISSCQSPSEDKIQEAIDTFRIGYAPDKRVALWDIHWDGKILSG